MRLCGCVVDHVLMRSMIHPTPTHPRRVIQVVHPGPLPSRSNAHTSHQSSLSHLGPLHPPTKNRHLLNVGTAPVRKKESACLGNGPQETPKKFPLPKPVIDSVTLTHAGRFLRASCCLYRPLKETMEPLANRTGKWIVTWLIMSSRKEPFSRQAVFKAAKNNHLVAFAFRFLSCNMCFVIGRPASKHFFFFFLENLSNIWSTSRCPDRKPRSVSAHGPDFLNLLTFVCTLSTGDVVKQNLSAWNCNDETRDVNTHLDPPTCMVVSQSAGFNPQGSRSFFNPGFHQKVKASYSLPFGAELSRFLWRHVTSQDVLSVCADSSPTDKEVVGHTWICVEKHCPALLVQSFDSTGFDSS